MPLPLHPSRKPRQIFVDPYGDDLDGDGSAINPFQSIARAEIEQQAFDLIHQGYEIGSWPATSSKPRDLAYAALLLLSFGMVMVIAAAIAWAIVTDGLR